jgi:hypothetical protein
MLYVINHISYVIYHISYVIYHKSYIINHILYIIYVIYLRCFLVISHPPIFVRNKFFNCLADSESNEVTALALAAVLQVSLCDDNDVYLYKLQTSM